MSVSWKMEAGLNHVPAYQASGKPYASASIDGSNATGATYVTFPSVTRWVVVVNNDHQNAARVGFSKVGVCNTNYFTVGKADAAGKSRESLRLEVKTSQLWISGSGNVDIVAGLTSIPSKRTSGSFGPNYSGSIGVG
jgi:hypothetical protein|tara:strand:+ start:244 stop:654 length:411 start_codon:yes stop_codon:yes gene_type:complete